MSFQETLVSKKQKKNKKNTQNAKKTKTNLKKTKIATSASLPQQKQSKLKFITRIF
jgi:hypothetical protein